MRYFKILLQTVKKELKPIYYGWVLSFLSDMTTKCKLPLPFQIATIRMDLGKGVFLQITTLEQFQKNCIFKKLWLCVTYVYLFRHRVK